MGPGLVPSGPVAGWSRGKRLPLTLDVMCGRRSAGSDGTSTIRCGTTVGLPTRHTESDSIRVCGFSPR
jgi:hypothetical protein